MMGAEKDPAFRETTKRQAALMRAESVFNDRRSRGPAVSQTVAAGEQHRFQQSGDSPYCAQCGGSQAGFQHSGKRRSK